MVLEINIWADMSLLDPFPDDTGHFVSIKVDDGRGDHNLGGEPSLEYLFCEHFICYNIVD